MDAAHVKSPTWDRMWETPGVGTLVENESQEGMQVTPGHLRHGRTRTLDIPRPPSDTLPVKTGGGLAYAVQ